MAKRMVSPNYTQCFSTAPRPVSLNDSRITWSLIVCAFIAFLLISHTYLGFVIVDMRMQTERLQQQHSSLLREESSMQHELEAMCNMSKLRDYARQDLRYEETDVRQQVVAEIPASLRDKYYGSASVKMRTPASVVADASQATRNSGDAVKSFLVKLVDGNKAFAASEGK